MDNIEKREYQRYRIKKFFRIKTIGIDDNRSMAIIAMVRKSKKYKVIVCKHSIPKSDEDLFLLHDKCLTIPFDTYTTIIFDPANKLGTFYIGQKDVKISNEKLEEIRNVFEDKMSRMLFLEGIEYFINQLNKH